MDNLICELTTTFGFTDEQIKQGIAQRNEGVDAIALNVEQWKKKDAAIPGWAKRAAARWVIEIWMKERDNCDAAELLAVDKRFSRILSGFSMGDIISMRNEINQKNKSI